MLQCRETLGKKCLQLKWNRIENEIGQNTELTKIRGYKSTKGSVFCPPI